MSAVEMADVYRSLVINLRDKLGGTINGANADAIARAAAQVYRREVEPRLWDEKSAHELLDGLGVPRSGAFVPYSLSDRLLFLRRSSSVDPYRAQAHEMLDELAVPRLDGAGHEYSLQARLTRLLDAFDGAPGAGAAGAAGAGPEPGDAPNPGDGAEDGDGDADPAGTGEGKAGPELVDALEAIQRAVGPAAEDDTASSPPLAPSTSTPPGSPPVPDLIGLGSLLGTIQEEVLEVRQAVESLRQEVRDAVALLRAGAGPGVAPPVVPGVTSADEGSEIVLRGVGDGPESAPEGVAAQAGPSEAGAPGAGPDFVPPDSGSPNGGGGESAPPDTALSRPVAAEAAGPDRVPDLPLPAGPAGPHDPTRVLPAVPAAPYGEALAEEPGVAKPAPRRRSRRFVRLILVVILVGALLAAGISAAVVVGWDELQSRFLDMVTAPVRLRPGAAP